MCIVFAKTPTYRKRFILYNYQRIARMDNSYNHGKKDTSIMSKH